MIRCAIFTCILGAALALNHDSMLGLDVSNMTVSNKTYDDLHITCDTMEFTMPGANILLFQDVALNKTNLTVFNNETGFNLTSLERGESTGEEEESLAMEMSAPANETTTDVEFTKVDVDGETDNSTTSDNSTNPELTIHDLLMFNDDVMADMKQMGFPFELSCQTSDSGESIDMSVTSDENSTQIVELLAQVHVGGVASGEFLLSNMTQDYRIACSGDAVSHMHSDVKKMMEAQWLNTDQVDLMNETNPAACVFSILDTNGNFWQMVTVPVSLENSTVSENSTAEMETEEEVISAMPPTSTDSVTEAATVSRPSAESETTPQASTTPSTSTDTASEVGVEKETSAASTENADKEESATDFEIKSEEEENTRDLGEITVDGETYSHHCMENNLIRVLVPYTGCSDFLTVVDSLPRAYQTCGLDKCLDVNDCECKGCAAVSCEKLLPGASQSYSISIYNDADKEIGVVSGERTRTLSGGLTESISARGDPRSSVFPIA